MAVSLLGGSMGYWLAKKYQGKLARFSADLGPSGFRMSVNW
ncbi:MAG: hypothetical protein OXT73_08820 [Bacteroidota bacterium]|nr:hypothetical protein [Bacteroidota bacterium]